MPDHPLLHWHTAALQAQLAELLPGLRVQAVAQVNSTNSALLARARGGDGQAADPSPACWWPSTKAPAVAARARPGSHPPVRH